MEENDLPKLYSIFLGEVCSIQPYGVFIKIPGYKKNGLVHKSQMSSAKVENPAEVLDQGEQVFCKVIAIDPDGDKIALSMKVVSQTTGKDLDPNQLQTSQDELRRKSGYGREKSKIELGAVLDTVCKKCGGKGHFTNDCFHTPGGKTYDLIPEQDEIPEERSKDAERVKKIKKKKKKTEKKQKKKKKHRKKHKKRESSSSSSDSDDSDMSSDDQRSKRYSDEDTKYQHKRQRKHSPSYDDKSRYGATIEGERKHSGSHDDKSRCRDKIEMERKHSSSHDDKSRYRDRKVQEKKHSGSHEDLSRYRAATEVERKGSVKRKYPSHECESRTEDKRRERPSSRDDELFSSRDIFCQDTKQGQGSDRHHSHEMTRKDDYFVSKDSKQSHQYRHSRGQRSQRGDNHSDSDDYARGNTRDDGSHKKPYRESHTSDERRMERR